MRRKKLHEEALQPGRSAAGNKKASAGVIPGPAALSAIKKTYRLLLTSFGPQGWWPVTPAGKHLPVYAPGTYVPPSETEMFEICAGAILTQNTSWKNVELAIAALNRARLLSPGKMAACRLERLQRLIRPSGYYRQKAARLKGFCAYIVRNHPEGLEKWFLGARGLALRAELLSITGIGPETADSITLYAAGKPSFIIDAYTRRIGERLGLHRFLDTGKEPYSAWKELFESNLAPDVKMYNEYHALLVELGKKFCGKRAPFCGRCPVKALCDYKLSP